MRKKFHTLISISFILFFNSCFAINADQLNNIVDQTIEPLMAKYQIPGIAVAITLNGEAYFFNYGVATRETNQPVTNDTLFEIASITKTFTGILTAHAVAEKQINLSDPVSYYLPELRGSAFDHVQLIHLITHTSGLPLYLPEKITTQEEFMVYLKKWRYENQPGTWRIYSHAGFALIGLIIGNGSFDEYENLLIKKILQPMGLNHTYFSVPAEEMQNYAMGYVAENQPRRSAKQQLLPPAYSLKSSSKDMIRYLQANMGELNLPNTLQAAIQASQVGYFKTADLIQALGWEEYAEPYKLHNLLVGNGASYLDSAAHPLIPALTENKNNYFNKTGSGIFTSYVAFIPGKKIGIVILANKFIPPRARASAGYKILQQLFSFSGSR